jgi:putative protease
LETAEKAVKSAFEKTGGTGLILNTLDIQNPNGLFVPLSVLNDLRRRLYERVRTVLSETNAQSKRAERENILTEETLSPSPSGLPLSYVVKTDDGAFFKLMSEEKDLPLKETIFMLSAETDLSLFTSTDKEKIRFALPTVARRWDTRALKKKIEDLLAAGFRKFEIANVWGLNIFKDKDVDLSFDWPVYVANSSAARAVLDLGASFFTVSPETPNPEALFKAFPRQAAAVIYQDPPLFTSEVCPYAASEGKCQQCGGNRSEVLTSRYGSFVSVMKNCRHFLLGEHPRIKKQEMIKAGAVLLRIEFLYRNETPQNRMKILHKTITG